VQAPQIASVEAVQALISTLCAAAQLVQAAQVLPI
jgi:hypothetical protein